MTKIDDATFEAMSYIYAFLTFSDAEFDKMLDEYDKTHHYPDCLNFGGAYNA